MTVFGYQFRPANLRQKIAVSRFSDNDVLFCLGEAGSGKTFLAIALALRELQEKGLNQVYITRPLAGPGEEMGHLPGDTGEKYAPFMAPIYDAINQMVPEPKDRKAVQKLFIPAPLAYLRGRTFADSIAILDEAQNCTRTQLKLFLTRLGKNSKLIITGDPHQSDIGRNSGLLDVVSSLKGLYRVGIVYFEAEDCVRHPLVAEILKRI